MKRRRVITQKVNLKAMRENPDWTFYAGFSPLLSPCPKPDENEEFVEIAIDPPPDRPDPPKDGEIVKLIDRELPQWVWREKFRKVARLIQAGIQKNEQGIEALRKLFRNHEERIKENRANVGELKHFKVKNLEIDASNQNNHHEALKHRVEQLEQQVTELQGDIHLVDAKTDPQPAHSDVAYAWDKDHKKKHRLRPGRSVVNFPERDQRDALFLGIETACGNAVLYRPGLEGKLGQSLKMVHTENTTWLRNLSFPGGDQ